MSKPGDVAKLVARMGSEMGPELDMRVAASDVARINRMAANGYLGLVVDQLTKIRWHAYRSSGLLIVQRAVEAAKA